MKYYQISCFNNFFVTDYQYILKYHRIVTMRFRYTNLQLEMLKVVWKKKIKFTLLCPNRAS